MRVLLGLEHAPTAALVRGATDLRIGYVPQRFDIDAAIPMTVERFLMLGCEAVPRCRPPRVPWPTLTPATFRNANSSASFGGELQRVVLARALLRKPNLLVLDEPVQGVDYMGEADLYNLIGRLRDEAGFGVLLVSHDLHIVMARSDRVICLNHHVCCSGVPETVAQHPAYGRLFGPEAAAPSPSIVTNTITATTLPAPRMACGPRPKTGAAETRVFEPFFVRAAGRRPRLAAVAAPLGCFVVWQRMAYFGETVAQAGLIGVALGLALQMDVTLGVLIVALAVAGLLLWFGRRSSVALNSILGLLHHAALAAGVIATSMIKGAPVDLTGFLFGDVFAVTGTDCRHHLHRRCAVLAVVAWLWQPLLRLARARGAGRRRGRRPRRGAHRIHLLLAVTIAVAMKIVGILLVMAFLVVPAVAARPLRHTRAHGRVYRPDCRRQRRCRSVAVGHSRQPRRPVDRHRHVDCWPGCPCWAASGVAGAIGFNR